MLYCPHSLNLYAYKPLLRQKARTMKLYDNYKLQLLLIDLLRSYNDLQSTKLTGDGLSTLLRNYDRKIQVLLKKEGV